MPTNQATPDALQKRMLRPLTSAESVWAQTALDDAFRQILVSIPDVGATLDGGLLPADAVYRDVVVAVTCAMVQRVLMNPDGVLEETTDDYTRRLDAAVSTGALYLTEQERALLSAGTGDPEGAFAVRPSRELPTREDWFPTTTTDTWPTGITGGRFW